MPETNVLTSILNSLYDDGNVIDGYTPLTLRDELVFHVKSLFKLTKLQYSTNYVKVGDDFKYKSRIVKRTITNSK